MLSFNEDRHRSRLKESNGSSSSCSSTSSSSCQAIYYKMIPESSYGDKLSERHRPFRISKKNQYHNLLKVYGFTCINLLLLLALPCLSSDKGLSYNAVQLAVPSSLMCQFNKENQLMLPWISLTQCFSVIRNRSRDININAKVHNNYLLSNINLPERENSVNLAKSQCPIRAFSVLAASTYAREVKNNLSQKEQIKLQQPILSVVIDDEAAHKKSEDSFGITLTSSHFFFITCPAVSLVPQTISIDLSQMCPILYSSWHLMAHKDGPCLLPLQPGTTPIIYPWMSPRALDGFHRHRAAIGSPQLAPYRRIGPGKLTEIKGTTESIKIGKIELPEQVSIKESTSKYQKFFKLFSGIRRFWEAILIAKARIYRILLWLWFGDINLLSLSPPPTPSSPQLPSHIQPRLVYGKALPEQMKHKYDFAAHDSGARIIDSSPSIQNVRAIQKPDTDVYLLASCDQPVWFVMSFNTQIYLRQIAIMSQEFYSSIFRIIEILGSDTYPSNEWRLLAVLSTRIDESKELFDVQSSCGKLPFPECWVRYITVRVIESYQIEGYHYCTLNRFQVFGSDVLETLDTKMKEEEPADQPTAGDISSEAQIIVDSRTEHYTIEKTSEMSKETFEDEKFVSENMKLQLDEKSQVTTLDNGRPTIHKEPSFEENLFDAHKRLVENVSFAGFSFSSAVASERSRELTVEETFCPLAIESPVGPSDNPNLKTKTANESTNSNPILSPSEVLSAISSDNSGVPSLPIDQQPVGLVASSSSPTEGGLTSVTSVQEKASEVVIISSDEKETIASSQKDPSAEQLTRTTGDDVAKDPNIAQLNSNNVVNVSSGSVPFSSSDQESSNGQQGKKPQQVTQPLNVQHLVLSEKQQISSQAASVPPPPAIAVPPYNGSPSTRGVSGPSLLGLVDRVAQLEERGRWLTNITADLASGYRYLNNHIQQTLDSHTDHLENILQSMKTQMNESTALLSDELQHNKDLRETVKISLSLIYRDLCTETLIEGPTHRNVLMRRRDICALLRRDVFSGQTALEKFNELTWRQWSKTLLQDKIDAFKESTFLGRLWVAGTCLGSLVKRSNAILVYCIKLGWQVLGDGLVAFADLCVAGSTFYRQGLTSERSSQHRSDLSNARDHNGDTITTQVGSGGFLNYLIMCFVLILLISIINLLIFLHASISSIFGFAESICTAILSPLCSIDVLDSFPDVLEVPIFTIIRMIVDIISEITFDRLVMGFMAIVLIRLAVVTLSADMSTLLTEVSPASSQAQHSKKTSKSALITALIRAGKVLKHGLATQRKPSFTADSIVASSSNGLLTAAEARRSTISVVMSDASDWRANIEDLRSGQLSESDLRLREAGTSPSSISPIVSPSTFSPYGISSLVDLHRLQSSGSILPPQQISPSEGKKDSPNELTLSLKTNPSSNETELNLKNNIWNINRRQEVVSSHGGDFTSSFTEHDDDDDDDDDELSFRSVPCARPVTPVHVAIATSVGCSGDHDSSDQTSYPTSMSAVVMGSAIATPAQTLLQGLVSKDVRSGHYENSWISQESDRPTRHQYYVGRNYNLLDRSGKRKSRNLSRRRFLSDCSSQYGRRDSYESTLYVDEWSSSEAMDQFTSKPQIKAYFGYDMSPEGQNQTENLTNEEAAQEFGHLASEQRNYMELRPKPDVRVRLIGEKHLTLSRQLVSSRRLVPRWRTLRFNRHKLPARKVLTRLPSRESRINGSS